MDISGINLLVNDYDEALNFYRDKLGVVELERVDISAEQKWIKLGAANNARVGLILAKASTSE